MDWQHTLVSCCFRCPCRQHGRLLLAADGASSKPAVAALWTAVVQPAAGSTIKHTMLTALHNVTEAPHARHEAYASCPTTAQHAVLRQSMSR
jgi:hypothetical protein